MSNIINESDDSSKEELSNSKNRKIEQWLAALPVANIGKSAEMIYQYLGSLPYQHTVPKQWFNTLELFSPTIKYLWHALRKYYLEHSVIPERQKNKIIVLSQEIEIRYATMYASILPKIVDLPHNESNNTLHVKAILRVFNHLTRVLLSCYQLYTPAPTGVWLKLHKLFLHAEKFQLLKYPVIEKEQIGSYETNIYDAYKHCVLLAAANPFQLQPHEIELLHSALFTWASGATIHLGSLQTSLFVIDFEQDKPVEYQKNVKADIATLTLRGLNTTPLANHLNNLLKQRTNPNSLELSPAIPKQLLQYLYNVLGNAYTRQIARFLDEKLLKIAIGLDATFYFINGKKTLLPEPSIELPPHSSKTAASTEKVREKSEEYNVELWESIDASEAGICIQTKKQQPTTLKTHTIIAIQQTEQAFLNQWSIGLIRWIQRDNYENTQDNEQPTKLGIAILAPTGIAIHAYPYNNPCLGPLQGLLLPNLINLNQPATIILPTLKIDLGDYLHIVGEHLEHKIQINDIFNDNQNYVQFGFDIIQTIRESISLSDELPTSQNDQALKQIWNEIDNL